MKRLPTPLPARRAGFAILELLIAGAVLALGLVALTSATWRSHALTRSLESRAHADRALRTAEAGLRSFSSARKDDPTTWGQEVHRAFGPAGTTAFQVPELDPIAAGAPVGTILLVTDETVSDEQLGVALGMPRDLDGDGLATNPDVAGNGVMYPVVLTTNWRSEHAERVARRGFILVGL